MPIPRLLFPHSPLEPRKPDFDFEEQQQAVADAGFEVGISGLPPATDPADFYRALAGAMETDR